MSKNRPSISPQRIVKIFKEMQWWREAYFSDNPYEKRVGIVNGAKFWEWLAEELPGVRIRFDRYLDNVDTRVAFVLKLDLHIFLNVSKKKFEAAKKNSYFPNFVLAHEFAHIALEHSEATTAAQPFSLHEEDGQLKSSVNDLIESEAHYGAVFLQVGEQIFADGIDTRLLAKNAATDPHQLDRLAKLCQLESVRQCLRKRNEMRRVVL